MAYDPLLQPFLAQVRREVALACLQLGVTRLVDLGCGTGRQCIVLDRHGFQVTGVDSSPAMLRVARTKSPSSIVYIQAEATCTPLPSRSMDAVLLSFALHENPPRVIRDLLLEARRLLRLRGRILIADYAAPGHIKHYPLHLLGVAGVERLAGREHFTNYRRFLAAGATLALPRLHPFLGLISRRPLLLGCACLAIFRIRN